MILQLRPGMQLIVLFTVSFLGLLTYGLNSEPYYFGSHDGPTYFELAGKSIQGGPFHCGLYQHAYWSPAWVEVTAGLYRLFTHHPHVVTIFLSWCVMTSAGVVYLWGRQSMGHVAGLAASALSIATVYVFNFTSYHQYELFVGVCLVLACYLTISVFARRVKTVRGQLAAGLAAGVLISLSVLSAAKTALIAIVIAISLCLSAIRGEKRFMLAAYLLAGIVICGLWVLRNNYCFDEFIPVTTNGGVVYYIAHNPSAQLAGYVDPLSADPDVNYEGLAPHDSASWYALGNAYIAAHPVTTANDALIKFFLFFKPRFADQSMVIALMVFVIWRKLLGKRNFEVDGHWWLGIPLIMALVHSIYHLEPRYILPVWPFLSLFAAQAFATKE